MRRFRDCPEPTWWNGEPGELPSDPENDPANFGQCDACGKMFPLEDLVTFFPRNVGIETTACPKCRRVEEA